MPQNTRTGFFYKYTCSINLLIFASIVLYHFASLEIFCLLQLSRTLRTSCCHGRGVWRMLTRWFSECSTRDTVRNLGMRLSTQPFLCIKSLVRPGKTGVKAWPKSLGQSGHSLAGQTIKIEESRS